MARALACYKYGPVSISGPSVTVGRAFCALPLFRGLFSSFPPSTKINTSNFQFDLESVGHIFVSCKTFTCNLRKTKQFYSFYYFDKEYATYKLIFPFTMRSPSKLFPLFNCERKKCQVIRKCDIHQSKTRRSLHDLLWYFPSLLHDPPGLSLTSFPLTISV